MTSARTLPSSSDAALRLWPRSWLLVSCALALLLAAGVLALAWSRYRLG